ncbi:hypothetical protein [Bradyrhizobium neotropicale]|nr:hypothetical protein [Bradyrhizobium neotropicale]
MTAAKAHAHAEPVIPTILSRDACAAKLFSDVTGRTVDRTKLERHLERPNLWRLLFGFHGIAVMKTIGIVAIAIVLLLIGFVLGQSYSLETLQKLLDTPASTVALLAALFAFVSGVGGPLASYLIGSRQADISALQARASTISADAANVTALNAGSRELARVRLIWLQALRDNLSEYHSILMSAEDPHDGLSPEDRKALKDNGSRTNAGCPISEPSSTFC